MSETATRGRFEVVRLIGRGAMGAVYLAHDTLIGRPVALKTVHLDSLQDQPVAGRRPRLGDEARTAGRLSHPNIVAVYDVLEENGGRSLSIAMEYVEGTHLAEVLRQPVAPSLETALDLCAQIADGLAYAHGQGVIHRDVKPENILLTRDGRVKIADFGIAHLIDSALAEDLRFLGTPSYMAPERIRGEEVDQRSDLFSVGVVLYELLTHRLPFEGDTVAAITRRIVAEDFTPIEHVLPDVPASVTAIVRKALEKEPARRYGSATELSADLRRALASRQQLRRTQPVTGEVSETDQGPPPLLPELELPPLPSIPARAPSPAAAARRAARARRRPAWIWAAAAAALLVLAVAGWVLLRPASPVPVTTARPAPGPPPHLAPLRAGLDRLDQGDARRAEAFLRSAALLAPDSQRTALLHELALRQQAMTEAAELELTFRSHLERARAELAARRPGAARVSLQAARALDPDREEIAELERELEDRSELRPAAVAAPPPAPTEPVAVARGEAPTILPLEAPAPADNVRLLLDFQSEIPRGALTVYSGDRQIFREGFRFVEKTRFLLTRGVAGSFSRTLEHPVGEVELRIYLSLPKHETQLVRLEGTLRGGTTRMLRLRVAADGGFTARLQ